MRSRANRARTALLGIAIGIAAVVGISMVEGQALHWYTPAWEAALCGIAGYMLARSRGGFLNGTALFAFAYMATVFLREAGYDSTRVIGRLAEARTVSLHADFAALLSVAVLGGLIGFISDRR